MSSVRASEERGLDALLGGIRLGKLQRSATELNVTWGGTVGLLGTVWTSTAPIAHTVEPKMQSACCEEQELEMTCSNTVLGTSSTVPLVSPKPTNGGAGT